MNSKDDLCCIKEDIHKAYDLVNWKFLLTIMAEMNFPICWIKWIHTWISITPSKSSIVNLVFESSNGLRKGDPLAPYFFVLTIEGHVEE